MSDKRLLQELYTDFISEVLARQVRGELEWDDASVGTESDQVLSFFYAEGVKRGCSVETNSRTVKVADRRRYGRDTVLYGEEPKEYLVDLCWRTKSTTHTRSRVKLALELEWTPVKPHRFDKDEIVDEDLLKLLDVRTDAGVGILGVSLRGRKTLAESELGEVIRAFSGLVRGDGGSTSYLLIFVDRYYSDPLAGAEGHLIDHDDGITNLGRVTFARLVGH